MKKNIHSFFNKSLPLFILLLAFQQVSAQCPQRYRDKVFAQENSRMDNLYGINKQNTDSTYTWQAFDVYEPKNDTAQVRPIIVLIHGGGFSNWPPLTRKSPDIQAMAKDLAKRGYVVISPEYRLFSGEGSYKKLSETLIASVFDINQLMCFLSNTVSNGNPYRLDTSRFFLGGVSAGAFIALNFGYFINDTSDISAEFRIPMNIVAALDQVNPQTLFQNKFCGIKPKGVISISGALLDTSIIKPSSGNILFVHGLKDRGVPYMIGSMRGVPLYGLGIITDNLQQAGYQIEADIYPDKYHVPVLHPFGENLDSALLLTLQTGTVLDIPVFDSTVRHIASFCYRIMGSPVVNCLTTSINQNVISGQLHIFPNPSGGYYTVELPSSLRNKKIKLVIYDVNGKTVKEETLLSSKNYNLNLVSQHKGIYWMTLRDDSGNEPSFYVDKLILQ